MPDIFLDFGNADVKYFDGMKAYSHYRHAIAPITESEWRTIVGRSKMPPVGYIAIEGKYFAIGDKAVRYVLKEKPRGADRYTPDYYGVAMAYAISELYPSDTRLINLFASHAPRDAAYVDDIRQAALGYWHFTTHNGTYKVHVKTVECFDEPAGGFNHAVLTKDGRALKNNPYRDSTVLVLDVGGYTCDVIAVDPQGMIDDNSYDSTLTGVISAYDFFERELRSAHKAEFKGVGELAPRRLETAMLTGKFPYGNSQIDCADLGKQAINSLVNNISEVIKASGGVANFDVVLLTGGGSALVHEALKAHIRTIDFILVEPDRELMRYANVFGGAKLFAMLKRLGVLNG